MQIEKVLQYSSYLFVKFTTHSRLFLACNVKLFGFYVSVQNLDKFIQVSPSLTCFKYFKLVINLSFGLSDIDFRFRRRNVSLSKVYYETSERGILIRHLSTLLVLCLLHESKNLYNHLSRDIKQIGIFSATLVISQLTV